MKSINKKRSFVPLVIFCLFGRSICTTRLSFLSYKLKPTVGQNRKHFWLNFSDLFARRITAINNLCDHIALELVCEFSSGHFVLLASKVTKQGVYKSRCYSHIPPRGGIATLYTKVILPKRRIDAEPARRVASPPYLTGLR